MVVIAHCTVVMLSGPAQIPSGPDRGSLFGVRSLIRLVSELLAGPDVLDAGESRA